MHIRFFSGLTDLSSPKSGSLSPWVTDINTRVFIPLLFFSKSSLHLFRSFFSTWISKTCFVLLNITLPIPCYLLTTIASILLFPWLSNSPTGPRHSHYLNRTTMGVVLQCPLSNRHLLRSILQHWLLHLIHLSFLLCRQHIHPQQPFDVSIRVLKVEFHGHDKRMNYYNVDTIKAYHGQWSRQPICHIDHVVAVGVASKRYRPK